MRLRSFVLLVLSVCHSLTSGTQELQLVSTEERLRLLSFKDENHAKRRKIRSSEKFPLKIHPPFSWRSSVSLSNIGSLATLFLLFSHSFSWPTWCSALNYTESEISILKNSILKSHHSERGQFVRFFTATMNCVQRQ